MTTSGVITSTMTARQVVTRALKLVGVLQPHDPVEGVVMDDGIETLNLMLKSWQITGPQLWRATEGTITLVSATATYTLSPRPVDVYECRYRNASGIDLPMERLNRDDHRELPQKSSAGIPTTWYFDKQRDSSTITTWPVLATATTETLRYTYQRVIEDVTNANEHLDVPQEALDLVIHGLAVRMFAEYGATGERARNVRETFMEMKARFDAFDREDSISFEPAM